MRKFTPVFVRSAIRKFAFASVIVLSATSVHAQKTLGQFWGLTSVGGSGGVGVLFNYTSPNSNDSAIVDFPSYKGIEAPTYSDLIQMPNGTFYGTSASGGEYGYGTVFKCTPSGVVTVLVSLTPTLGETPEGGVTMGPDGYLYGLATNGGSIGYGTIFKCDTLGNCSAVFNFDYSNFGGNPNGKMLVGKDDKLYGLTYDGGSSGNGLLFSFDTLGNFNVVANMQGFLANGSLVQADDSNLYGMTVDGGGNGFGSIFKCSTSGAISTIYSFTSGTPEGSLIQGQDKMFYGMSRTGGTSTQGSVFSCDSLGNFTTLYSFINSEYPYGNLVQAADGSLYGMTNGGGTYGSGTVFQCTTTGTLTTLVNLNGVDGLPEGSLTIGQDGNLYGMATGTNDYGAIFKCSTAGTLTNIYYMGSTTIGSTPYGSLIQAYDGNMYGMTNRGGAYAMGTIFQVTPAGVVTTVASLNDTIGSFPDGSLVQGADSNLYGLAYNGGSSELGGAFKYSIKTNQLYPLASFTGTNGSQPYGSLVKAKNGTMYGMTSGGGTSNYGTVFKLTTTGTLTTLSSFANREAPRGSLIQGTDGNLYGLALKGKASTSSEDGSLFVCDTTGKVTTLVGFHGSNGSHPEGSLIQGVDGNLYGMTYGGGAKKQGEIFKSTTKGVLTTLYSFLGNDLGGNPSGSLIQGTDSSFYGMTTTGGTVFAGVTFKLTPQLVYDTLFTFNDSNGYQPEYGNLLEYMSASVTAPTLTCNGYLINAAVSGGGAGTYTYKWSNGVTTSSLNVTNGGVYSVLVTNAKGLTVSATSVSIPLYNVLQLGATTYSYALCSNSAIDSATVSPFGGAGGYTYVWNTTPTQTTATATGLLAGNYIVTVTDANVCSATYTVTVTAPAVVTASISASSNPICNNGTDGTVTAMGSGGTPSYTYSWNSAPIQTTATATGLGAGNYTVTVTDANLCPVATATVTLANPATASVATATVTNASCGGCSDGSATVIVSGGYKNVITWSDSTSSGYVVLGNHVSDSIKNIGAGTYVCTVSDSCGDSKTDTIRITQPGPTGIQNQADSKNVNVYPMPNNGHFAMALTGSGFQLLTIHDETGHEIYRQMLDEKNANTTLALDLSMYADGIYFAQVVTTHGVLNKKIVIQK